MYVDGVIVGEGLSMVGEAAAFSSIGMSGDGVADNLLVTTERPLGLSSDGDALPDEWLSAIAEGDVTALLPRRSRRKNG